MQRMVFSSYDEAEKYLTGHMATCEFREVKSPCYCIVEFPCQRCSKVLTKTGTQALTRIGSQCEPCRSITRADMDRGHQANRKRIMERTVE